MSWHLKTSYKLDDLIIYEVLINNPCCVGKLYKYIEHPDGSMSLDGDLVSPGIKKWIKDEHTKLLGTSKDDRSGTS